MAPPLTKKTIKRRKKSLESGQIQVFWTLFIVTVLVTLSVAQLSDTRPRMQAQAVASEPSHGGSFGLLPRIERHPANR